MEIIKQDCAVDTHTISSFMRWAQRRIADEVKANDEKAKKYGEHNVYTPEKLVRGQCLSIDEKLSLVMNVDKLRREGMSAGAALRMINLSNKSYYRYRKQCGLPKFKK